jgi:hypothetical protein
MSCTPELCRTDSKTRTQLHQINEHLHRRGFDVSEVHLVAGLGYRYAQYIAGKILIAHRDTMV